MLREKLKNIRGAYTYTRLQKPIVGILTLYENCLNSLLSQKVDNGSRETCHEEKQANMCDASFFFERERAFSSFLNDRK